MRPHEVVPAAPPILSNGIANLHNARRAYTSVVNIVGDHASYHEHLDAPGEITVYADGACRDADRVLVPAQLAQLAVLRPNNGMNRRISMGATAIVDATRQASGRVRGWLAIPGGR
jgi:hypothetical protein